MRFPNVATANAVLAFERSILWLRPATEETGLGEKLNVLCDRMIVTPAATAEVPVQIYESPQDWSRRGLVKSSALHPSGSYITRRRKLHMMPWETRKDYSVVKCQLSRGLDLRRTTRHLGSLSGYYIQSYISVLCVCLDCGNHL